MAKNNTADTAPEKTNAEAQGGAGQAEPAQGEQPTATPETPHTGAQDGANAKPVQYVYIGPTLPNGRLKENAVFIGKSLEEITAFFDDLTETHPQIKRLFVPVDKLGGNLIKVRTPGNLLHKYYHDIASAIMHGATVVAAKEE